MSDIDKVVRALVASLDVPPDPPERLDLSPILAVMWTILSLDRQKPGAVRERIEALRKPNPDYGTLPFIRDMAEFMTPKSFFMTEMRDYEGKRAPLFLPLLNRLIDELRDFPGVTETEKGRAWAAAVRPSDWSFGPFRGLGLKGFQHLRQLLGANTVVPTKGIVAWVARAIGREPEAIEAVYLLERAAGRLRYDLLGIQEGVWGKTTGRGDDEVPEGRTL